MTRLKVRLSENSARKHPLPPATLIRLPQEVLHAPSSSLSSRTYAYSSRSRPGQASLHLRRHDEAEARGRARKSSPDGKWVIFSVVDVDLEANTKTPHIWIVPTARWQGAARSSPIRTATARAGRRMGSGLRFCRRRKADRRSGSRISMVLREQSRGVHKLTSIATEAGGELWSPDGKNILFTSDVYPECDGDASRKNKPATRRSWMRQQNRRSKRRFSITCSIAIGTHIKKGSARTSSCWRYH